LDAPAKQRRIAVTGGGTAGHILPALELLRAYRAALGSEGYFIGCAEGLESRIVPPTGEILEIIPGLPVAKQGWSGKLAAIASLRRGILAARRILRRERTEVVIGFGGYAAFGACVAARSLGLPVVIHDSNAAPGLANRTLAMIAQRVCVGFEEAASRFGSSRVIHTGTPCRAARPRIRTGNARVRFLVMGGSLGSPHLNREAPRLFAALRKLDRPFSIRHLVGFQDAAAVRRAYEAAHIEEARIDEFVEDMASAYAESDFVISCSGGLALAELAAAGLPALLVPFSAAAYHHQTANARAFADRTGAIWVAESEWDAEQQAARIARLLDDPGSLERMSRGAAEWAVKDASQQVIGVCEDLLDSKDHVAARLPLFRPSSDS
jgi:UDP-N-acetylglucosamine--N-acetylmuramyl-(pentapeptide) pyrophosphoryl-undecaprenol N-acetylglucosamine transferase